MNYGIRVDSVIGTKYSIYNLGTILLIFGVITIVITIIGCVFYCCNFKVIFFVYGEFID